MSQIEIIDIVKRESEKARFTKVISNMPLGNTISERVGKCYENLKIMPTSNEERDFKEEVERAVNGKSLRLPKSIKTRSNWCVLDTHLRDYDTVTFRRNNKEIQLEIKRNWSYPRDMKVPVCKEFPNLFMQEVYDEIAKLLPKKDVRETIMKHKSLILIGIALLLPVVLLNNLLLLYVMGLGFGITLLMKEKLKMNFNILKEKVLVKKKKIGDKEVLKVIKEFAPHLLDSKDNLKVKVDNVEINGIKYSLDTI